MGTIACSVILNRAAKTLFDETGDRRWPVSELLDYLNAGVLAVIVAKPDAGAVSIPFELQAGSQQEIPEDFSQFLGLTHNLGVSGSTPGRAIRPIERAELDNSNPGWHTASGSAVHHFVHDPRLPKVFWVFPRVTGWVELQGVQRPAPVTDASYELPIDDLYEGAIYNWVMAHAYAKSTKSGDMVRSTGYMSLFASALGLKLQRQFAMAPKDPDVAAKTGEDT